MCTEVKHIFHTYIVTRELVWKKMVQECLQINAVIYVFISLQASWQSVYLSWITSSLLSAPSAAQHLLLSFQSSFISSLWLQKATGASLCLFSLKTALSWSWACLCSCLARTPRWYASLNDIKQEKINRWIGNCDQEDNIILQKKKNDRTISKLRDDAEIGGLSIVESSYFGMNFGKFPEGSV